MLSRWLFFVLVLLALAEFVVPQKGGGGNHGGSSGGGARPGGGGGQQSRPQSQQPRPQQPTRQTQRPDPPKQTHRPDPPKQSSSHRPDPPRNTANPGRPTNSPGNNGGNNGGWGGNNPRPTVTTWRPNGPGNGNGNGNRPPDRNHPDWKPYNNPWDRPGNDNNRPWGDRPRGGGGDRPWRSTTIIGGIPAYPTWAGPNWDQWRPQPPRTVYTTWDSYGWGNLPAPWANLPRLELPPITINLPAPPRVGCSAIETTYESVIETTQTFTDTITQPPADALVTVYVDPDSGETSTDWGPVETVYEVIVYTTTATVDVIQTTTSCGLSWGGW